LVRLSDELAQLLERRTDARPLAVGRIVIGLAALARAYEASRIIERYFLPTTIKLPYATWVPELTERGATFLLAIWAAAALLFAAGWWTRAAGFVLTAICLYVVAIDEQLYSNHLYLLAMLSALLALADAGAEWSIDAWRRRRRETSSAIAPATVPAWPVFLLKTQLSSLYLFSALSKLNGSFLSGVALLGYLPSGLLDGLSPGPRVALVLGLSWGAIAAEAFLAVALWSPRWRPVALLCGIVLHAGMILLLPAAVRFQLAIFAAEALAIYPLFAGTSRSTIAVLPVRK
jgi:vitamin K-dependent gamma-carboxylase-like protein